MRLVREFAARSGLSQKRSRAPWIPPTIQNYKLSKTMKTGLFSA